jgi:hypothetical protein
MSELEAARKLLRSIAYGPPRVGNPTTILNGFVSAAQAHLSAYSDNAAPPVVAGDSIKAPLPAWLGPDTPENRERLQAFVRALAAPPVVAGEYDGLRERFPEINPSNYDHDDVCALNSWGFEAYDALAAMKAKAGEATARRLWAEHRAKSRIAVLTEALTRSERKLSAYVGVCKDDKELTEAVLPLARAALKGGENV